MNPELTHRVAIPEDEPFLRDLFVDARPGLEVLPAAIVDMQMRAQRLQYEAAFPGALHSVVMLDGVPVGMVWVQDGDVVRLLDIAVSPAHRGQGVGTLLLQWLMGFGKVIELHVDLSNPARRLYERLGFVEQGQEGLDIRMVWTPPTQP